MSQIYGDSAGTPEGNTAKNSAVSQYYRTHIMWGVHSPLAGLFCGGLIAMASARLAYALTVAGALFWVYGLSTLVFMVSKPVLPQKGLNPILIFLTSLIGGFYLFLLWFPNPLLVSGTVCMILLVPCSCIASGIFERVKSCDPGEAVLRACREALVIALLMTGLALIREPVGCASLSLPGGVQGIIEVFGAKDGAGFFPVRILAGSAGAFILMGYGLSVYARFRKPLFPAGELE
ncbi:MAG: hypothetical protein LBP76_13510 [Treponema sp.]|jgi:hypothetical protein|nr:hypothetical protein [Treponema sp.]